MSGFLGRTDQAAKRALIGFDRWLACAPEAYRKHVEALVAAEVQGRQRLIAAERRAETAEKRERDSGRGVALLKRRIAELESR